MSLSRATGLTILLLACALIGAACKRETPAAPADLTEEEQGLIAPDEIVAAFDETPLPSLPPVPVTQARDLVIRIQSEQGYENEKRQHVIDVLERDYAYLAVVFQTPEGNPVSGVHPELNVAGSSRIVPMLESLATAQSDDSGIYEFGVVGGSMGAEVLTITAGVHRAEVLLNIISLRAAGYPELKYRDGMITWERLSRARIRMGGKGVTAEFPSDIQQLNGQEVTLTGFMMPLEIDMKQKRFLLTSNPPSCFFHIPGGPAGAVEVTSRSGVSVTWDPIVVKGRLETVSHNEMGVIYRLHDARPVKQ